MLRLRILLLFSILLPCFLSAMTLEQGVINLSSLQNRDKSVPIIGEASIYWNQFLTNSELDTAKPSATMHLPGVWNSLLVNNKPLGALGYATIVFKITADKTTRNKTAILLSPIFSSYRLYIDSSLLITCGDPQKRPETSINCITTRISEFTFTRDTANVILHIANFANNQGGPWEPIFIGNKDSVYRQHKTHQAYDLFLLGGLLAFMLAYFFSFFMNTHDGTRTVSLWFALYTTMLFIRLLCTGTHSVYEIFPDIPFSMVKHFEFFSFFLAPLFYHSYIHLLFGSVSSQFIMNLVRYVTISLGGITLLTPLLLNSEAIMPFQISLLLLLFYHIIISIKSFKIDSRKSIILLLSTIILVITVGHDILQCYGFGLTIPLVPLGGVIVAMLHSYYVARNSHRLFVERNQYALKLSSINKTLSCFVPNTFFDILKESPETVKIGTQIRKKMAVIFCDIRNSQSLFVSKNSEKRFSLVSAFLKEVTPFFTDTNGVIDKYIDDSVMVIFPEKQSDAMQAALNIVEHFNSSKLSKECEGIQIGIGIHYGPMTLGVIGAEDRMENTVIGDAVNTASRMQRLTHKFDADIIVSNEVINGSHFESETFHLRSLGSLAVKGKRERTTIQEIFFVQDGESSSKLESRNSFEQAIVYYESKQYEKAELLFLEAMRVSPTDSAIHAFLESCRHGGSQILKSK